MPAPRCCFALSCALVLVMLSTARTAAPPLVEHPRVDAVGDKLPDDALARFGTARFRVAGSYTGNILSPDGKLLAVPSDGAIRLIDTATGNEARRIIGERNRFHYGMIEFSLDSKLLALTDDNGIVVCDVVKGVVLSQFRGAGHGGHNPVSFSGDGKLLAVGALGSLEKLPVTIWDVAGKKEKMKIEVAHDHEVHVSLSPDAKTLAVWGRKIQGKQETDLQLWDMGTGKVRLAVKPVRYTFQQVVFSPDGKQMVTIEYNAPLSIHDPATGRLLRKFKACVNPTVVAYSPDGKLLATAMANGPIQLWDPKSGKSLGQCDAPPQTQVGGVAFTEGNKVLALGFCHHMLRLWEVPGGRERTPALGHQAAVSSLSFARDGKTLVSAGADGVRLHDLGTGKQIRYIGPPADRSRRSGGRGSQYTPSLSPAGRRVVWGEEGGERLTVVDTSSGKEIVGIPSHGSPFSSPQLAFSGNGNNFASLGGAVAGANGHLAAELRNLGSGVLKRRLPVSVGGYTWCLALSPRGRMLVVASTPLFGRGGAEPIALWNVATGKEITRLPITTVNAMAFSPDGSMLATSGEGVVSLWDTSDGRMILNLPSVRDRDPRPMAFSPDGRLLALRGEGRAEGTDQIRVWELASGKVRTEFIGHHGGTRSLAFSPDSGKLASGGTDTTVMLWDVTGATTMLRRRKGKPTLAELAGLWADLDNPDARKAHIAMARLTTSPAEALALFRKELKPIPGEPPSEKEVERLITDLGADSFEVREKASNSLADSGLAVRAAIIKALAVTPDLEKKRRLEKLLRALRPGPTAEMIRPTRALEVLERLGTPEARRVVQRVAKGNPAAGLTMEAERVLKRMQRMR